MILLNVVCFGAKSKFMHEHVLGAQDSGHLADSGRFRLDEWPDRPQPGMLERPALVTYVPAHGSWMDDGTSCLGTWGNWYSFEEFGKIGGSAVVLDACSTASDSWLYDQERLRPECQSLAGKPVLGGSGAAEPHKRHGVKILGALLDLLADVEETATYDLDLLPLLCQVRDRAVAESARSSTLGTAYAARTVDQHLRGL